MGVTNILVTQEYKHAYCMWKSIAADNRIQARLKSHFQEAYLDKEELEKTARISGCGSPNNLKHGEMEDAFMNFASATSARDAAFTKLTTTNGNFLTQLRQQKDQI